MNALNSNIARDARRIAATLLDDLQGARAVVIATADGFEVAHAGEQSVDPARLAAIVSSIAALGDAASRETAIGLPRCLVVESTEGRLVIRCIEVLGESLIVVLLTNKSVLLGLALNALAEAERQMAVA